MNPAAAKRNRMLVQKTMKILFARAVSQSTMSKRSKLTKRKRQTLTSEP